MGTLVVFFFGGDIPKNDQPTSVSEIQRSFTIGTIHGKIHPWSVVELIDRGELITAFSPRVFGMSPGERSVPRKHPSSQLAKMLSGA